MKNAGLAKVRRLLVAYFIVNTPAVVLVWFTVAQWNSVNLWIWILANVSLTLPFVIDAAVTSYYLRKIQLLTGPLQTYRLFFIEGVTWKFLKTDAIEAEKIVQEVLRRAQPFPKLNILNVLQFEGIGKARELVEHAEHEAASAARVEEERQRREEKRTSGIAELVKKAVALGIDEKMALSIAATDIDQLRATVADQEQKNELLGRAVRQECLVVVEPLVKEGRFAEAEMMLIKSASFLERASELGVSESVRAFISKGEMAGAELALVATKKRQEFDDLTKVLEQRIKDLPQSDPEKRRRAYELLEALGCTEPDSRSFRQVLHRLEEVLTP